jgi:hypothetical protein
MAVPLLQFFTKDKKRVNHILLDNIGVYNFSFLEINQNIFLRINKGRGYLQMQYLLITGYLQIHQTYIE